MSSPFQYSNCLDARWYMKLQLVKPFNSDASPPTFESSPDGPIGGSECMADNKCAVRQVVIDDINSRREIRKYSFRWQRSGKVKEFRALVTDGLAQLICKCISLLFGNLPHAPRRRQVGGVRRPDWS